MQNELLVFPRNADGTLEDPIAVKSGGYGNQAMIVTSGQNAVIHTGSGNNQYVLMINAGFNPFPKYGKKVNRNGSVSVFKVNKCSVRLTDVKSTRGQEPRAVTRDTRGKGWYKRDLVYVVNNGSGRSTFNGCPGLPPGFLPPTGLPCLDRDPIVGSDFDPESIIGYRLRYGKLRYIYGSHVPTADPDGDPAQISFMNEGRQVIVANRSTNFALGDGTEDDLIEVFNLDKWGRPGKPIVSETTGNDNFGFSVYPRDGSDYNDCVMMTHGSFQQRDQGGVSVFTVNGGGSKVRIIPNKPDGGSDTCWTAISRTNTLYTSAFFDSEVSIRAINPDTCNLTDGGPPIVAPDGVLQFTGAPLNYTHRVSSHYRDFDNTTGTYSDRGDDISLKTDQSDFLLEAGGLDMAVSKWGEQEYLYVINAAVPFYTGIDGDGNFTYPPAEAGTTQITAYRVLQSCDEADATGPTGPSMYQDGCRIGDLELVERKLGTPGSGFGAAAM